MAMCGGAALCRHGILYLIKFDQIIKERFAFFEETGPVLHHKQNADSLRGVGVVGPTVTDGIWVFHPAVYAAWHQGNPVMLL